MAPTRRLLGLAGWILLCLGVAAVSGLATVEGTRTWYPTIAKPSWTPPSWLFGPVWTALYVAMGVAAWRVWRIGGFRAARTALGLFLAQLAVNGLWSPIFFAWHRLGLAVLDIGLLWLLIVATIVAFRRHDRVAALLLLPYLAWVTFASALTVAIWRLNG
jgi:tryptophan-rich sensory protein